MASWEEQLRGELAGRGVAVSSVPGKGRALIATRRFLPGNPTPRLSPVAPPLVFTKSSAVFAVVAMASGEPSGEVIIREEPYVSAPHNFSVGSSCDNCFSSRNLRKCSVCRVAWYCGRACQAIPSSGTDNYSLVDALDSHISEVDTFHKELHAQMAILVLRILPSLDLDIEEIAHTFSKITCNAFSICDPQLKPLGTGVYLVISTLNHSCVPNAIVIFEGRTAYLRAVQPIDINEEVSISYIDTAATTVKRQEYLKPYYFSCTCRRCEKDSEEDALLEGFRCKDQKCDGFLLPNSDYSEAGSMYKIVEEQERKLYHTLSTTLLRTWDALSKIHIELNDFQTALKYTRLTIPVYERVYTSLYPLIGWQLYICGKLEWY
ncbi:hypothetical protein GUJ93_ZPchr0013g35266 [Zizania palustris]|uniref:SET domain-containing protein n=1 Tax=Zizania palustris TaxID=103762 RepID=A0A8J6C034_ZIZPA|nr:hypothetical protein GUJ93_ZPchr0013g35266 [Zizania palustris]